MNRRYTLDFKIQVITDYYTNDLGVRQTAAKWGLPSKNYVTKWENYLKRIDKLPKVPKKPPLKAPKHLGVIHNESQELKLLREENEYLRAKLDILNELEKLGYDVKKKIDTD